MKQDILRLSSDIAEMDEAMSELEAKREDVRQRHADQLASDGNAGGKFASTGHGSRTERRMDHIEALEKRTALATDDRASRRRDASVEREIEQMQRHRKIEEELSVMRDAHSAGNAAKKSGKRNKAA